MDIPSVMDIYFRTCNIRSVDVEAKGGGGWTINFFMSNISR